MKNNKILFKLSICLFFNSSFLLSNAQNTVGQGSVLPSVGYWEIGTTKNVRAVYATTKISEGKTIKTVRKTESTWKIVDSTANNYIIHYTLKNFYFENKLDSFSIAFAEAIKGITLKYCTSETGVYDSIINLDEVSKAGVLGIEAAFETLKWNNTARNTQIIAQLKLILTDLVALKASMEEELIVIHYFNGMQFQLGKLYSYDTELPSLIGGQSYPSKINIKLNAIMKETNLAKFSGSIAPNNASFHDIAYKNYFMFCENYGLPTPLKSEVNGIAIAQKIEASYTLSEAWPVQITFTKINNTPKTKLTELMTLNFD